MSATLSLLADRLFDRPLLVEASKGAAIVTALADRLEVAGALPAPSAPYRRPNRAASFDKVSGIAVLPVIGTLVHRGDSLDALSGVVSYVRLQNDLTALLAEPSVTGILLDIDSGGGEVAGLQELADFLLAARAIKPIWAFANTRAASAAYWLAACCERVIVAPHGAVGSIGVLVQHQDVSKALEKRGVVTSFVFAGRHKVDGNPFEPLPDSVRARLQTQVDALYAEFVATVAKAREIEPVIVRGTEALMIGAEQAVTIGLADAVGTYGATLQAFAEELGAVQATPTQRRFA